MARILYIEDDAFLQNIVKKSCEGSDIEVLTAEDAQAAFSILKAEQIDLILLDLLLPGEDGFKFLEEKNEDAALKDVPVVVFSNLDSKDDRERALSLGALEYHVKVLMQPKAMMRRINEILKERGIT